MLTLVPHYSVMSNLIPPMISDSPPPLDVEVDDNDDEDGFGDFRVAADLAFDLSGALHLLDNSTYSMNVFLCQN